MTDPTLVAAILARASRTYHQVSYAYPLGVVAIFIIGLIVIGYLWRRRDWSRQTVEIQEAAAQAAERPRVPCRWDIADIVKLIEDWEAQVW